MEGDVNGDSVLIDFLPFLSMVIVPNQGWHKVQRFEITLAMVTRSTNVAGQLGAELWCGALITLLIVCQYLTTVEQQLSGASDITWSAN